LKSNGTYTETAEEQAQVLNEFFSSVFTKEDLDNIPSLDDRYTGDPLEYLHITSDMVLKKFTNQLVHMDCTIVFSKKQLK
jgi:hypothetical protein